MAALAVLLLGGAWWGAGAWQARRERQRRLAADGVLSVRSAPPSARVWVEGREVPGRTPLFARGLRKGVPLPVEVRLDGYRPWRGTGKVHEKYGDGVLLVDLVPLARPASGPASASASARAAASASAPAPAR